MLDFGLFTGIEKVENIYPMAVYARLISLPVHTPVVYASSGIRLAYPNTVYTRSISLLALVDQMAVYTKSAPKIYFTYNIPNSCV